jgi:hypothetical protein
MKAPPCLICHIPMQPLGNPFADWIHWACLNARCDYATMTRATPTPALPPAPIASRIATKREKAEAPDEKSPDPDSWTALDLLF